jgi:hypothetical protein
MVTADDIGLGSLRNKIRKLEHELSKPQQPEKRARLEKQLVEARQSREDLLAEYSVPAVVSQ